MMAEKPYMVIRCAFSKRISTFPLFSWILQVLFKKPYSHVLWYFERDHMDLKYCYEAIGGGTRGANYHWWKKYSKALHYYEMPITKEQWKEIFLPEIRKNEGRAYGKLQIIGLGLVLFVKFLTARRVTIKNPFGEGWICSETILRVWLKLYGTEHEGRWEINILGRETFYICKEALADIDSFTHVDCDTFMGKHFERREWQD